MKPALKWEVPHKEGLQNLAHEEIKIPDSVNWPGTRRIDNWLLRWGRGTEAKRDDGRKGLAKGVDVKIRWNKEVFCRANEWAFQVKATEVQHNRWNYRWKDHLREKPGKIPKSWTIN